MTQTPQQPEDEQLQSCLSCVVMPDTSTCSDREFADPKPFYGYILSLFSELFANQVSIWLLDCIAVSMGVRPHVAPDDMIFSPHCQWTAIPRRSLRLASEFWPALQQGPFTTKCTLKRTGERPIADPAVVIGAWHTYRNFSGNPLFSSVGPQATDVNQGDVGDCYFLAGLAAIAEDRTEVIRQRVVDFDDGTYGVRLRNSFYRVDGDLPVSIFESTDPVYARLGRDDSIWVAITSTATQTRPRRTWSDLAYARE